jgi:RNA polymerase-binding protein DksA
MNRQELGKYKNILQDNRKEILERVDLLVKDKTRTNGPLSKNLDRVAQEVENDIVVDKIEGIQLTKFKLVQQALERIAEGSYGVCINCGKSIKVSRLNAIPFSSVCIDCAN